MKRLFVLLVGLLLIVAMGLAGCDSDDDNGGGGTTPAAATTHPMAGTWEVLGGVGGLGTLNTRLTIDANGTVTQYMSPWWLCGGQVNSVRVQGSLSPTGGQVTYGCRILPQFIAYVDQYRLRVVHQDRLEGSLVTFYRSQLLIPKTPVILVRR